MDNHKKVPSIRFKGFTNDWEQYKLSDIVTISKGTQINRANLYNYGKYYVLNGGMTPSGYTNTFNTKANTVSVSEGGNSCGFVAYNTVDFWSGGHNYTLLHPKINVKFLYQYLKQQEAKIMALRVGSGLPNIQKNRLSVVLISVPNVHEQKIVSDFLFYIDNLITLHQQKHDKLLNIKKAMLKKMFPKEGEKVPEIRFKSFSDEWEQCKIKDITDRIIVGLATSVTPYYRESGVPLLRNMNIKENHLDDSDILYLDEKYAKANESKMIHANDVLTVHTGSNIGLTCITPEKYEGCLSFTTLITTPNKNTLDSLFLMQYMNSTLGKMKIEAIITAGGKPNLNSGDLEKLEVVHPNIEEQHDIGKFFQNLDNLITFHQHKIEKLKKIKKAMIEKMFV